MGRLTSVSRPARSTKADGTVSRALTSLLGQRNRAVALVAEPAQQVRAILGLRQTGEGHLGARRELLRVGDELVEVREVPGDLQVLDRVVVVVVFFMRARTADHAPEI